MNADEYEEWEEGQPERHEFYNGHVYAMAGGSEPHARIISNLHFRLRSALGGRGCTVYTEALRVRVEPSGLYTYPDLSVVCEPPAFASEKKTTLTNPLVLVDVLSPSTSKYDEGAKLDFYVGIPSLRAYVLVWQDYASVRVLEREPGGEWTFRLSAGLDASARVEALGAEIALADVYEGVTFPGTGVAPFPMPSEGD